MRFLAIHKLSSYLLVLTGTLALVLSGELHGVVAVALLGGIAASWFWEPPRVNLARFEVAWNVATILFLAKSVVDVVLGEALLVTGVNFLCFLLINKLFNRRTSRDYLQIYVLSFLQMVAGTTLGGDLSYGITFVLYVVFSTWTLILFHLKREMEENYLLKYGGSLEGQPVEVDRVLNSRRLVGPRFLAAASLVSLLVFLGSTLVFALLPRVGFGMFFKKQRSGILMAGFSDRVELGQFGVIKDDPRVVMRVELPQSADRARLVPYWRGIAFDHYDGRTWTKSRGGRRQTLRSVDGYHEVDHRSIIGGPEIVQAIYLEPMDVRVIFALPRLHGITLQSGGPLPLPGQQRGLGRDREGDVHYQQMDEVAFRYFAHSRPEVDATGRPVHAARLALPLADYRATLASDGAAAAHYTQLPPDLDPRVAELAAEIIGDARTVGEAVDRVESHLRTAYGYTLDLQRDARYAPLEDFLFVQRRGHCEYFSTALVILLRTQGIGARNVNGFYGGQWNRYGDYLAVSQGDAHSWAEIWLPGHQWVTRDATPAGGAGREAGGTWQTFLEYVDALRLRWYKYVIEYDLQKQVGVFLAIRDLLGSAPSFLRGDRGKDGRGGGSWVLAAFVGCLAVAALVVLRRRQPGVGAGRAPRPDRRSEAAAELYRLLERAYARLGHARRPATTAREWLAALRAVGAPDAALAERVVEVYEAARFGGAAPDPAALKALAREVRRIGKGARRGPLAVTS